MRSPILATLLFVASLTQAGPTIHAHKHAQARNTHDGGSRKYEAGIFYVSWAIYGRQHFVPQLPFEKLTKINYAFANLNNMTGEVFLGDEWADAQFAYPGDVATNGTQLLGNLNQLFKLKQKNRNLKVILSVGGWTWRGNFSPGLSTEARRQKFCDSALALIADLGVDGLDIDWEYPKDKPDADNFVDTVRRCRKTFDDYAAKYANGYHFSLGISAAAGPQNYEIMNVKEMDPYVDNWNLMAFDYQGGGFSKYTGHQSNVYPSKSNPKSTDGWIEEDQKFIPFNTKQAVDYYKANIASPEKLCLGMPLYGRSFANVVDLSEDGRGMGQKFNGSGRGTWEPGALDYKVLPLNGSKVYTDKETLASWSWDVTQKEIVTFDIPKVALWKTDFLKEEGLGGPWWWESAGDLPEESGKSLVSTVMKELGVENLRQAQNNLYYPVSKYYNIRGAMSNSTTGVNH